MSCGRLTPCLLLPVEFGEHISAPDFFFFLTLESILLAPEVMNHPVAAPRGCPFLLPEADQGEPWS